MGEGSYVVTHWTLMYALVLAFQFTPLKIEWIGLVVIGIYAAVYVLLLRRAATGAWRPAGPITERPSP
jgi:hypothetical protein